MRQSTSLFHSHPDALSIITHPQTTHSPILRMLAWAILKEARGQTIQQRNLPTAARRAA